MSQKEEPAKTETLPTIGQEHPQSSQSDPADSLNNRQQKRVLLAIEYIRKHYRNKISAEQLSFEVNLSVAKLQAGMKAATGKTVAGFIEHVRIEEGKILLSDSDRTVAQIAKEVGFKTQSHFGDVFKKLTGYSPLQFRNCYGC